MIDPKKGFMKKIFITGIAGFIGFHLAKKLHQLGFFVAGCDNFNDYYNPVLKKRRASQLKELGIEIFDLSIEKIQIKKEYFKKEKFFCLINLAAQAGVRYSLVNPNAYIDANLNGFFQILELLKDLKETKLIFASSSSVYGLNNKSPFAESDPTIYPANLYAATKACNELLAFSYHHIYKNPMIGLRFFTVYGPWGRPDMAYFSFAKSIDQGQAINVYNFGEMKRDFTYIDDIVDGIIASIDHETSYDIFNLGNSKKEPLLEMIQLIEGYLGKKATLNFLPMQPGDLLETCADISKSSKILNFSPKTSLKEGLEHFINWYKNEKELVALL